MTKMEKRSALLSYFQHDVDHEPEDCYGPCRYALRSDIKPEFPEMMVFQYQKTEAHPGEDDGKR